MLCIIFTTTKMLVGTTHTSKPELFPLMPGNRHEVSHENNYLGTLQTHFERILYCYAQSELKLHEGYLSQHTLPRIVIVLPDANQEENTHIASLTAWILTQSDRCLYGGTMDFYATFLKGYQLKMEPDSSFLLVDTINNPTSIYRYNNENSLPKLQHCVPDFSMEHGLKNLEKNLQQQFQRDGIILDDDMKAQLKHQLENFSACSNLLFFNKKRKNFEINFQYFLTQNRYENMLTDNRGLLRNILNINDIEKSNVTKILFCGDLSDNDIFRDFCINVLQIEKKIIRIFSNMKIYSYICTGINKTILSDQQTLGNNGLLSRKSFLERIQNECTEKKKFEKYAQKYVPIGQSVGLSENAIVGLIRAQLYGVKSLQSIGRVVAKKKIADRPSIHELTQSAVSTTVRNPVLTSPLALSSNDIEAAVSVHVADPEVLSEAHADETFDIIKETYFDDKSMNYNALLCCIELSDLLRSNLGWFFRIEKFYNLSSCISFKGKLKESEDARVFYFLPTEAEAAQVKCFESLRDRNLLYYANDVSDVKLSAIGSYYSRPYYEGMGLETYINSIELNKKIFFNELTSSELELILEVWKEINLLPFAINIQHPNEILINTKWKLPFKRKLNVALTHLDIQDISFEEMYDGVHQIFQNILSKSLYEYFRANFNNY